MNNLVLPDVNHPDFYPVYNEVLEKGKVDQEIYSFVVPSNNGGLAIPATKTVLNDYFGDKEYEARQAEILREEQDLVLVLPGIVWDD